LDFPFPNPFLSNSESETLKWAEKFSELLKHGDTIGLFGNLGTGKTILSKGISKGLGFKGNVHSPSYSLVNEYPGTTPVYHIDLYRLPPDADWEEIGLEHYFQGIGIVMVEWAEKLDLDNFYFNYQIHLKTLGTEQREIQVTFP